MRKRFYVVLAFIILIVIGCLVVNSLVYKKGPLSNDASAQALLALYNNAKELESKNEYLNAKAIYIDLLGKSQDEEFTQKVQKDLMGLNINILFSPLITEDSELYTVTENDTLGKIAKRFNTTVELIMKSNNLQSDFIRIGKKLKISKVKYSLIIDCSQNTLTLLSDQNILKIYKVSTGIDNSTPRGTFKIVNKLKDPVWYKAGAVVPSGSPDNILGSRWMGISMPGYGIHGTNEPESIGKYVTAGCVRMNEPQVQELYIILAIGTEVTIID